MGKLRGSALILAAAVVAGACGSAASSSPSTQPPVPVPDGVFSWPSALPRHLGIGVSADLSQNGLNGWVPDSKIPFDYVYQYLAGGVNDSQNWESWDTDATFPLDYAQTAAKEHHIPVFSYYMLKQSDFSCNCSEAEGDLRRLNNKTLMAAYYENFKTLMQRLGSGTWNGVKGFGGTAIVHVEPDLSGYAEQAVLNPGDCYGLCRGTGNQPALLEAAVGDTGVANVAGYPDNYLGFNQALLHLRDLYAPNVLLAFHESPWSTGQSIATESRHLNAGAIGKEAATFALRSGVGPTGSGVSTYDLVFTDVADRDAAVSGSWWDPTNQAQPDFQRWETYVAASAGTYHKPVFVWQVPLGNQWFDTEDGASGHTQDNRIDYFFAHPQQLVGAGVAAVLYGAGNAGSTTQADSDHDGVTNPAPTCYVLHSVKTCATHRSVYADDDGGYLRIQSRAYYAHPLALPQANK